MIASYPRSGSTWFRFLVAETLAGKVVEFDSLNNSIPDIGGQKHATHWLAESGRLIKTHESFSPKYHRAIYLVRDVRDVVTSEYRYQLWSHTRDDGFEVFLQDFIRGEVNGFGGWTSHVTSWLEAAEGTDSEVLVIRYEDLRVDALETVKRCLEFLGIPHKPANVKRAVANNTLAKMRAKESRATAAVFRDSNPDHQFVGTGVVGGWRKRLSREQLVLLEEWASGVLHRAGYALSD